MALQLQAQGYDLAVLQLQYAREGMLGPRL